MESRCFSDTHVLSHVLPFTLEDCVLSREGRARVDRYRDADLAKKVERRACAR